MSYLVREKIKQLSSKLEYLAIPDNPYKNYVEHQIKIDNLRFNLSFLLSNIILNLKFVNKSKSIFVEIIEEYNAQNNKNIKFEDFVEICWVRIINNEIIIPEVIRKLMWNIGHSQEPFDIPENKKDLAMCLQIFYNKCLDYHKPNISKENLDNVLKNVPNSTIDIDFLIEKEIIELNVKDNSYNWIDHNHNYSRYLRNEIASTLWILLNDDSPSEDIFRKYIKYIYELEIYPDNLKLFLSEQDISKICELSYNELSNESDLKNSEYEFTKIWFDSPIHSHVNIHQDVPNLNLDSVEPIELIEEIEHHWRYKDFFSEQSVRELYGLLIDFILQYDNYYSSSNLKVLSLLQERDKPFIVFYTYNTISKKLPQVLPYLIYNVELIPLALKIIDELEINNTFLPYTERFDEKNNNKLTLINELWFELFEISQELLFPNNCFQKEKAKILGQILYDVSKKVFTEKISNRDFIQTHQSYRKRYDKLYKIINDRMKYYRVPATFESNIDLLDAIFSFLKNKKKLPPLNNFVGIDLPRIDLFVKILKILKNFYSDDKLQSKNEKVNKLEIDIASYSSSLIINYFLIDTLELKDYTQKELKKEKVERRFNDFGLETINWGWLYLFFQKYGLLNEIDIKINSSIIFDNNHEKGKYADQNVNQYEKIKIYLKSLLLAYIDIQQNIDNYLISEFTVTDSLLSLEKIIKQISLKYSVDNILESRVDVFAEEGILPRINLYRQTMISLLFKCVNYFESNTTKEFVTEFFNGSIDIGRMLKAANIIETKVIKEIISDRASRVDINDYLKSFYSIKELEKAVIEAINSDTHWDQFTEPFLKRMQEHIGNGRMVDEESKYILYEVNLILAFKNNDFEKLKETEVPIFEMDLDKNKKVKDRKSFFIALFELYNNKNYEKAISEFNILSSQDPKDFYYAYHLYKAETLRALELNG